MSEQEKTDISIPTEGPVAALLQMGKATNVENWEEVYGDLGLTLADVPVLIRFLTNEELLKSGLDQDIYAWTPIHTWRALAVLQAGEAVQPLLGILYHANNSEWVMDEIPRALGMIGEPALRPLARYMRNPKLNTYVRVFLVISIAAMAGHHPELRQECVTRLEQALGDYAGNDHRLNGYLVASLADLKAVEAMPTIEQAYREQKVDPAVYGDLEDVEIAFGLRQERSTPRPPTWLEQAADPQKAKKRNQSKGPGRNEPCPCGSGKKYKKCCMNNK